MNTPNLDIPFILTGQAQKEMVFNDAMTKLDAIVQLTVVSKTETSPPVDPVEGERYIVPTGATGDWSGQDGNITAYYNGWKFYNPGAGWLAFVESDSRLNIWNGSSWQSLDPIPSYGDLNIVNGDFEASPDLDGWTISSGTPTAEASSTTNYDNLTTGYDGSTNYLKHDIAETTDFAVEQEISLLASGGGTLWIQMAIAQTVNMDDTPFVAVQFLDGTDTQVGDIIEHVFQAPFVDQWFIKEVQFRIPTGTAKVVLQVGGKYNTGSSVNAGIDYVSGWYMALV